MAREAYSYLIVLAVLIIIAGILQIYFMTAIFAVALLFIVYFFRDPERQVPQETGIIVSPADGRVTKMERVDPQNPASPYVVSIFLSPLDVHINRSPVAGRISTINHIKGRFVSATRPESSLVNEQNVITFDTEMGTIIMKQIAGVIARRCVLWKVAGDAVALGERVGLIKFSSRTDLIIPATLNILIKRGDRVQAGVTIIGRKSA
jgi:phosphatidylserine decarboxylase